MAVSFWFWDEIFAQVHERPLLPVVVDEAAIVGIVEQAAMTPFAEILYSIM